MPRADLRGIPSVAALLDAPPVAALRDRLGAGLLTALVREDLDALREEARAGRLDDAGLARRAAPEEVAARVARAGEALLRPAPRPVVNATGVVVHTNLGRSVLSSAAARRVAEAATGYLDLEYDLREGRRGSRQAHLAPLLSRLFPGHAALAVNNNAAAILLALRALARGREVIVSRGELVEIGGSFRVPEILAASGARLREVGTTNRTRAADYREALGPRTGALLKVHTSNFRIVGFAEEAGVAELAGVAREAGVPLVVDWGSGDLADLADLGIRDEIPVGRLLADGADLVTFSGDKLLGGPQAGLAVGRPDLVRRMAKDPVARAVRIDRLQVAALAEVLGAYARGRAWDEVPTLRMLALTAEEIGARAEAVRTRLLAQGVPEAILHVLDGVSRTGGGSSPAGERPTRLLAVGAPGEDAGRIEKALRGGDPPVLGRLQDGRLLLDLRTVPPEQDGLLAERLAAALARRRSGS